jgi:hypothetical protein
LMCCCCCCCCVGAYGPGDEQHSVQECRCASNKLGRDQSPRVTPTSCPLVHTDQPSIWSKRHNSLMD